MFSYEICENTFFHRTPLVAACEFWSCYLKTYSDITHQKFVGLENVFKTPSRHALKTCSTNMSWKGLEDMFWRCLEDILKISLEDVFSVTIFRLPRRLQCVSNKSIFHKSISDNSKANPKCINYNPIISNIRLILELKQHLHFKN